MRRAGALLVVGITCCCSRLLQAQVPRLAESHFVAPAAPAALSEPVSPAITPVARAATRADSTHIARTYWLEGGLTAFILFGGLAGSWCYYEDSSPPPTCVAGVFVMGGAAGFPIGALIGGQFHKR